MNILLAAHQGDIDTVRQRLSAGEDVDTRDEDGLTPLHLAALCNHLDIVRLLLSHGTDVKFTIYFKWCSEHALVYEYILTTRTGQPQKKLV